MMARPPTKTERKGPLGLVQNIRMAVFSWIWKDLSVDISFWRRPLNVFARVFYVVFEETRRDAITLRARGLTLMVFISIIPMLAMGTAIIKGLGDESRSRVEVYRFFDKLIAFAPVNESVENNGLKEHDEGQSSRVLAQETLSIHLRTAVDKVFDYVDRTNFATLGLAGILGVMIIVIPFFNSMEQSMNTIWQIEKGRPFGLKILNYLVVIILLPIAINVGLAATTVLESPELLARVRDALSAPWMVALLLKMMPGAVVILVFTALYRVLPNTRVEPWPAFVGGMFGGIGWILTQALYLKLQIGVARYNAIYGSFATIPLFLLWIYVAWIIFLAGAEVSFAVKNWRVYLPKREERSAGARLGLCIDVLIAVFDAFRGKKMSDREGLSRRLKQPENQVGRVLRDLCDAGFIRRVEGAKAGYVPAGPVEETDMAGLIRMIYGKGFPDSRGGRLAKKTLDAAMSVLGSQEIDHLLGEKQAN